MEAMNGSKQFDEANAAYFNGSLPKFGTQSSTLVSASRYLNSAALRDVTAQEMLRRNGADITPTAFIAESAGLLSELEDWPRIHALFEEEKARLPLFREFCEDRRMAPTAEQELRDARPGTLRALLYDFVVVSGYDLTFGKPARELQTEIELFHKKRTLSHDIEHMLTGFDTDCAGEVALATANTRAFYAYFQPELAAFLDRLPNFLGAAKMVRSNLYYPEVVKANNDALDMGAAAGRNWKCPLFLLPYCDLLDWQVQDIREEYGIRNLPPKGLWTWTIAAYEDPRIDESERQVDAAA